jgi:bifunctional non-homologous end joining protein LigD
MTTPPRKPAKPLLGAADAPVRSRPRRPRDHAQPNLPLDPMLARIEPCLALLKPRPPQGPQWTFEVKWDGIAWLFTSSRPASVASSPPWAERLS